MPNYYDLICDNLATKDYIYNAIISSIVKKENNYKWVVRDEVNNIYKTWNDIYKTQEEKKKMNKCEFVLGSVIEIQDEIANVQLGKAIIVCPGYNKSNVTVIKSNKGVSILFDNDDMEIEEFCYGYNEYYTVENVSYTIKDGVLTLSVDYNLEGNVEISEE